MPLTQSDVEKHLRLPPGQDADILDLYTRAAWEHVRAVTGEPWPATELVPASVEAAVLLLIGDLYENREASGPVKLYENRAVTALLWPYRRF